MKNPQDIYSWDWKCVYTQPLLQCLVVVIHFLGSTFKGYGGLRGIDNNDNHNYDYFDLAQLSSRCS